VPVSYLKVAAFVSLFFNQALNDLIVNSEIVHDKPGNKSLSIKTTIGGGTWMTESGAKSSKEDLSKEALSKGDLNEVIVDLDP
jgi:hypothetical protein